MPSDLPRLFPARHGDEHIIRITSARWLGLPLWAGRFFDRRPASAGVLGFEHRNCDEPVIGLWNNVAQPRD